MCQIFCLRYSECKLHNVTATAFDKYGIASHIYHFTIVVCKSLDIAGRCEFAEAVGGKVIFNDILINHNEKVAG